MIGEYWTDEKIDRLRKLWAEGLSTSEIGRRMGVGKNSVVGKAHRLNLPSRPSPIKNAGNPKPRKPAVHGKRPTLPPIPSVQAAPDRFYNALAAAAERAFDRIGDAIESIPRASQVIAAKTEWMMPGTAIPVVRRAPASASARLCQYPIGEPRTPQFRFCEAAIAAASTSSYCAACHDLCHTRAPVALSAPVYGWPAAGVRR